MPVLGRTNQTFPSLWLALGVPATSGQIEGLIEMALEQDCPLDITSQPGLWGRLVQGKAATLMMRGNGDLSRAGNETQATDFVQAHLFQTLCSLGSEKIDFYFLTLDRALEEFQISGALQALEQAKQDGHIRFIGLNVQGPALAILPTWQFHDAFEVALLRRNHVLSKDFETLEPFARERRVGVVTSEPFGWPSGFSTKSFSCDELAAVAQDLAKENPVLVPVHSVDQVLALRNTAAKLPDFGAIGVCA